MTALKKVNGHDTQEREYRVKWAIDVDATSPEEAARLARHYLTVPGSTANEWEVCPTHDLDHPIWDKVELAPPEHHHFFVCTLFHFSIRSDLTEALADLRKAHKGDHRVRRMKNKPELWVWRLPGLPPHEGGEHYEIKMYAPQLMGAELITTTEL